MDVDPTDTQFVTDNYDDDMGSEDGKLPWQAKGHQSICGPSLIPRLFTQCPSLLLKAPSGPHLGTK